jgi:hypothetical protein
MAPYVLQRMKEKAGTRFPYSRFFIASERNDAAWHVAGRARDRRQRDNGSLCIVVGVMRKNMHKKAPYAHIANSSTN